MKQFINHPNIKSITVYGNGKGDHAIQVNNSDEVYPFKGCVDYMGSIECILEGTVLFREAISDYRNEVPDSVRILTINFK